MKMKKRNKKIIEKKKEKPVSFQKNTIRQAIVKICQRP